MDEQTANILTPELQEGGLQMSVNELLDFSQKGRLPQPIRDYYQANDRLPAHLYVPLANIIDGDMAAQERATVLGKPGEARTPDDYRVDLYANDPIMRALIDPFRLERQAVRMNPVEVDALYKGVVPTRIIDHTRDYTGELPATTLDPVRQAVIETTLERRGLMYPAFEQLYVNSLELPGMVDEPIRVGLKEQGLLPVDTQDWRAEIAHQRESSEAIALGIAEGIQTNEISMALPDQAAHLRQYLEGDNYLSNEEINRAVFDSQTSRETMNELVVRIDTSGDTTIQQQLTDYLMELQQNVQVTPALQTIGHKAEIDVLSAMEITHQKELHKARLLPEGTQPSLPSEADQTLNKELIDRLVKELTRIAETQNKPEQPVQTDKTGLGRIRDAIINSFRRETGENGLAGDRPNRATSGQTAPELPPQGQSGESQPADGGSISTDAIREAVSRGFQKETAQSASGQPSPAKETNKQEGAAPFTDTTQKKPWQRADQESLLEKIAGLKILSGGMLVNLVHNAKKVEEFFNKLFGIKPEANQTQNQKSATTTGLPAQITRGQLIKLLDQLERSNPVGQTTARQATAQASPGVSQPSAEGPVAQRPSLLKRMADYFLDKIADKVAPRIQHRQAETAGERTETQPPVQPVHTSASQAPAQDGSVGKKEQTVATIEPKNKTDEVARQQQAYIEQPKKYTWEQIASQLEKIGVKTQHLDPMNRALLLDGRATRDQVPIQISDKNGLTALAKGQLMILEQPGKAPALAIVPPKLKTEFKIPAGLNLYPEDILRLQKTGMANRPVEMVSPTTGKKTDYLVGYDRVTKQLTLLEKDRLKVTAHLLGKDLTPQQQDELSQGRPIRVDGMKRENGRAFSATIQFSASQQGFHVQPVNAKKQAVSLKADLTPGLEGTSPTVPAQEPGRHIPSTRVPVGVTPPGQPSGLPNGPEPAVKNPLDTLSENHQKKWDNKSVTVAEGGNSNGTYLKRMGDLAYTDVLVLEAAKGLNTPAARIPLHDKADRGGLLPPSEQARIAFAQVREGKVDQAVKNFASPAEIQAAQVKYQVMPAQKTTNTAVVEKNGVSRVSQDQTGYRPTPVGNARPAGPTQTSPPPAGQAPPAGAKADKHKLSHNGRQKDVPNHAKPVGTSTPPLTPKGPRR